MVKLPGIYESRISGKNKIICSSWEVNNIFIFFYSNKNARPFRTTKKGREIDNFTKIGSLPNNNIGINLNQINEDEI